MCEWGCLSSWLDPAADDVNIRWTRELFEGTGAAAVPGSAVLVEDGRVVRIGTVGAAAPEGAQVVDLGGRILLPGLMDMELNLALGGPSGGNPRSDVQDDVAFRTLRATLNARATMLAGFTTVQSPGQANDVELREAIARGVLPGPRILT